MAEYFNIIKEAQAAVPQTPNKPEIVPGSGIYDSNVLKLVNYVESKSKKMLELAMKIKRKEIGANDGFAQWAEELQSLSNVSLNARNDILGKMSIMNQQKETP